ncbi:MAG: DUF6962 family protein [Putridiphycobacter sp.]
MVGADFPKIEFQMFGLDLLEPMALIFDSILGVLSVFFAVKVFQLKKTIPFYKYWMLFFLVFGLGAFTGGLGHVFFNQWGITGKIPSWVAGPVSIYFLEKAMISIHWDKTTAKKWQLASDIKLGLVLLIFLYLLITIGYPQEKTTPFLPIAINTIIGVISTAGILGFKYTEKYSAKFKFFWLGVLIMMPTAFIFLMKINVHQWFDKNDFSHILFAIGITYFYLGVKGIANGLKQSLV